MRKFQLVKISAIIQKKLCLRKKSTYRGSLLLSHAQKSLIRLQFNQRQHRWSLFARNNVENKKCHLCLLSYCTGKLESEAGKAQLVVRPACANAPVHLLITYRLAMLLPPSESINQSIKLFLKWPKWHSHCKDHWLGEVSKLNQDMIAEIKNVLSFNSRRKVDREFANDI